MCIFSILIGSISLIEGFFLKGSVAEITASLQLTTVGILCAENSAQLTHALTGDIGVHVRELHMCSLCGL